MPLYEVAILEAPSKKQAEDEGRVEKLIYGPKAFVAANEQAAGIAAAVEAQGAGITFDIAKLIVYVRPFAA